MIDAVQEIIVFGVVLRALLYYGRFAKASTAGGSDAPLSDILPCDLREPILIPNTEEFETANESKSKKWRDGQTSPDPVAGGINRKMRWENFDGDGAFEALVPGTVDRTRLLSHPMKS